MRIFLTGATGFIGSALVPELISAGHEVIGMTRSRAGAEKLLAAGAQVHIGTLEDLSTVRRGAEGADAVIHVAFDHDFSRYVENCRKDSGVIEALGSVLAGSDRPLVITSAIGMGSGVPGMPATEDVFDASHPTPRVASELAGAAQLQAGVNVSVVRLPQVHDTVKQGLITPLVEIARDKGFVAHVGEGRNRWAACHVRDAVRVYRLAVERAEVGARYHAVAEEGVMFRDIAAALGRGLDMPVASLSADEAPGYFGWMAMFAQLDMAASSSLTQAKLGWRPTGPDLISDLSAMDYSRVH